MSYFNESLYRCSACDFRCHDPLQNISEPQSLFALRVYELGNGQVAPVLPEEAFCLQCDAVVLAESLPDPKIVDEYISRLDNQRSEQYCLPEEYKQTFRRAAARWSAWAHQNVKRRRRCLTCGAAVLALAPVAEVALDQEGDELYRNYEHPGCPGVLTISHGLARHAFGEPDVPPLIRYLPTGERANTASSGSQLALALPAEAPPPMRLVEVYVLDPNGSYKTTWAVGKEIPPALFEKVYDRQAECVYAITTYNRGEPETVVITRDRWLHAKALFRRVDPSDG